MAHAFYGNLHAEQRQRERRLNSYDLNSALKYGHAELQPPLKLGREPRWKITYEDVVFTMDYAKTRMITCWALQLPLRKRPIPGGEETQMREMLRRVATREMGITSHTVLIVDQSGSMNESDVPGHRTRSRCVFYSIAMELIATPLMANLVTYTDVVTIVDMRADALVIIDREPVSWLLFNKIVGFAEQEKRGRGPGHFIPALREAKRILTETHEEYGSTVALLLFFLSDGRPSDHNDLRCSVTEQDRMITGVHVPALVNSLPPASRANFTFAAFGFASADTHSFEVLRQSADIVTRWGSRGMFAHGVDTAALRKVLGELSSLLTKVVTRLSSLLRDHLVQSSGSGGGGNSNGLRAGSGSPREAARTDLVQEDVTAIPLADQGLARTDTGAWEFHGTKVERYKLKFGDTSGAKNLVQMMESVPLEHPSAKGIIINSEYRGTGAERVAFEMVEVDAAGEPLGPHMVWKENNRVAITDQLPWHVTFLTTQKQAARLAKKFNTKMDVVPRRAGELLERHGVHLPPERRQEAQGWPVRGAAAELRQVDR